MRCARRVVESIVARRRDDDESVGLDPKRIIIIIMHNIQIVGMKRLSPFYDSVHMHSYFQGSIT